MSSHSIRSWRSAALAAAVLCGVAAAFGAQDSPPAPAASPSAPPAAQAPPSSPAPPVPAPLPVLLGPGYDTLRALAAALAGEMGHVLDGTQAVVATGRPARLYLPGVRMFKRRAESFSNSVEKYRQEPFDVVGTVRAMRGRAGMLSRRARRNETLRHTWEDWDAAVDILDRINRLLAGETVTVPPHVPRPAPARTPAPAPR